MLNVRWCFFFESSLDFLNPKELNMGIGKLKNKIWPLVLVAISVVLIYLAFFRKEGNTSEYVAVKPIVHSSGSQFASSESCMACHEDLYLNTSHTAHFHSSAKATPKTIKGSFEEGFNSIIIDEKYRFTIGIDQGTAYQKAIALPNDEPVLRKSIDMVIGSGQKGQTYGHWQRSDLFQLPLSYYAPTKEWTESPGVPFQPLTGLRKINAKCLECHTTFAKSNSLYGIGNSYEKERILYGIKCQRCHGPAKAHVDHHLKHPEATEPFGIISVASLPQTRRMDLCALCHSGFRTDLQAPFEYIVGEDLSEYSTADYRDNLEQNWDVHGNQVALLEASACFKNSIHMDCMSCHDPHQDQRGKSADFNVKCVACHTKDFSNLHVNNKATISKTSDCISCHMPVQPSKAMSIPLSDSTSIPVQVRTHLIGVYIDQLNSVVED